MRKLVTPKEARKYLGRKLEVKGLAFGFVMGVSVSIVAQILLLPLETKIVANMVELLYLGESKASISKDLYGWIFLIAFLGLLGLLYYGYIRIYGIPNKASEVFHHGTEHKKVLAEILREEFEKQFKPYEYKPSPIRTLEEDFQIGFEVEGRERLSVFVKDYVIRLECDIEKEPIDLADEVKKVIDRTIKNAKDLASIYIELLQRSPDESGFGTYVSSLNSGMPLDQVRGTILQSNEYKEKQAKKRVQDIF